MASNESWVVPASADERRYAVLELSDQYMKPNAEKDLYFGQIREEMENGGVEAMLHDLLQLDISKVRLHTIPKTKALLDQIMNGLSPIERFWIEAMFQGDEGESNEISHIWQGKETCEGTPPGHSWISAEETYRIFNAFCESQGLKRHYIQSAAFTKRLRAVCPLIRCNRATPAESSRQLRGYVIPPLNACRENFESKVGISGIDWDTFI